MERFRLSRGLTVSVTCNMLALLTLVGGEVSHKLMSNELSCQTLPEPIFLEQGRFPLTALASFPGSGSTWVRQILASASGYKTGDHYHSYGNDVYPEFSSQHDDTTIAIKTHCFSHDSCQGLKRALLLVRHPLDTLHSEFNRLYGGNKTGFAKITNLINEDGSTTWKWDTWMTYIRSWIDFYSFWLEKFTGDLHIIFYNNLKENTVLELQNVIKFLGLKPDQHRMNCTVFYPKPAYFKRAHTKSPVDKYDLFKLSMSKADKVIRMFRRLVEIRFGLESRHYMVLNLDISEPRLRSQNPVDER